MWESWVRIPNDTPNNIKIMSEKCKYKSIWSAICLYNKDIKDQFICNKNRCPLKQNNVAE